MTRHIVICGRAVRGGGPPPKAVAPSDQPVISTVEPVEGVTVDARTEPYDIEGGTRQALRVSLDRRRPEDADGVHFDAVTTWYVRWRFTYAPSGERCRMTSVRTGVEIRYALPRWRDPEAGGAGLRDRWQRYLAALRTHERGHGDLAVRAANAIQTTLAALHDPSCEALHRDADAAGQRILEQHRQRERAYDRETDHGRERGARFGG